MWYNQQKNQSVRVKIKKWAKTYLTTSLPPLLPLSTLIADTLASSSGTGCLILSVSKTSHNTKIWDSNGFYENVENSVYLNNASQENSYLEETKHKLIHNHNEQICMGSGTKLRGSIEKRKTLIIYELSSFHCKNYNKIALKCSDVHSIAQLITSSTTTYYASSRTSDFWGTSGRLPSRMGICYVEVSWFRFCEPSRFGCGLCGSSTSPLLDCCCIVSEPY